MTCIFIIDDVDFASYADDNTPYVAGKDIDQLIASLETAARNLFQWFRDNEMKPNASKCHLLLKNKEITIAEIEGTQVQNRHSEKLLGVTFDVNLSFNSHLEEM